MFLFKSLPIGNSAASHENLPATPVLTLKTGSAAALALLAALLAGDWLAAGTDTTFQMYGLNSRIALVAVTAAVVLIFSRSRYAARKLTALTFAMLATWIFVGLAALYVLGYSTSTGLSMLLVGLCVLLPLLLLAPTALVAKRIFAGDAGVRRPKMRAFGFAMALWSGVVLLPHWPAFEGDSFNRDTANYWELLSLAKQAANSSPKVERNAAEEARAMIELEQPARVQQMLSRLAPRTEGRGNIFVVGVAGWASQQVFIRELDQSLQILDARFGTGPRTVALANLPGNSEMPLATIQNLAATLQGVGERMDKENDVLLLTMTSHGSQNGFALSNGSLVRREIHPEALKAMLDRAGIKNRIVLVSSCYSGAFLRALNDEHTMVLTAAAADRTSFGCSDARSWTYFGDALFAHGLKDASTLSEAFVTARELIGKWEAEKNFKPSNPQVHIGKEVQRRFAGLIGDAVPPAAFVTGEASETPVPQPDRQAAR